jgi:hypothetical protein
MESTMTAPRASPQVTLDQVIQVLTWEPFIGPTGAFLWKAPASTGGTYTVSDVSCTCPSDQYGRGVPCKHRQILATYRRIVIGYLGHVETYRRLVGEHYAQQETTHDHERATDPTAAAPLRAARSTG